MRRALTIALNACVAVLPACYLAHERVAGDHDARVAEAAAPLDTRAERDVPSSDEGFPDAAALDAPDTDANRPPDTNPPALEAGPCDPSIISFPEPCSPEIEAQCERFAMEWAFGRYGHAYCVTGPDGVNSGCTAGDYCDALGCRCTVGRECAPMDVCVSDTPDGPRRCVARCSGF